MSSFQSVLRNLETTRVVWAIKAGLLSDWIEVERANQGMVFDRRFCVTIQPFHR